MMILRTLIATLILLTCSQVSAADSSKKVLVLFESLENSSSFSQYLDRIKDQGYEIEQRSATDSKLHLREWDTWKYSKLIIFASGIKSEALLLQIPFQGHVLCLQAVKAENSVLVLNLISIGP